jgi:uncharacterized protein (TIGR02611 family)
MRMRAFVVTVRSRARSRRSSHVVYRSVVGTLGGAFVIGGLLLVPLPGPGWLIVLLGLAILASEFAWAARLQHLVRRKLASWRDWAASKPRPLRWAVGMITLAVVIAVLVGGYLVVNRIDDSGGFWGGLLDRLKN